MLCLDTMMPCTKDVVGLYPSRLTAPLPLSPVSFLSPLCACMHPENFGGYIVGPVVQLGGVGSYKILSQSDCLTLDGVDDATQFKGVEAAFDTIGMEADSQMQVRQILQSFFRTEISCFR